MGEPIHPSRRAEDHCACGCGQTVKPGRRFRRGHYARVQPRRRWTDEQRQRHSERMALAYTEPRARQKILTLGASTRFGADGWTPWNKGKKAVQPSTRRGTKLSREEILVRTRTRRAKYNGHYVSQDKRSKRPKPHPSYNGRIRSKLAVAVGGIRRDMARYFRSRWEANYARYLTSIGATWIYEPGVFRLTLQDGTAADYRPDFLVNDQQFIELKGRLDEKALAILQAAHDQLPKPLLVIGKRDYAALERAVGAQIPHWELPGSARPTDTPHLCPTCGTSTKRLSQKYCSRKCQPHPFTGRKHSPESIAKRQATKRERREANEKHQLTP